MKQFIQNYYKSVPPVWKCHNQGKDKEKVFCLVCLFNIIDALETPTIHLFLKKPRQNWEKYAQKINVQAWNKQKGNILILPGIWYYFL